MGKYPSDTSNLTALREKTGLTQEDLAANCYLDPVEDFPVSSVGIETLDSLTTPLGKDTIVRMERQEREGLLNYVLHMRVGALLKLCRGLGVSPRKLWDGLWK